MKYARGFIVHCFDEVILSFLLIRVMYLHIPRMVNALALGQFYDCINTNGVELEDIGEI